MNFPPLPSSSRPARRRKQIVQTAFLCLGLACFGGCATLGPGERMVKTELFFGDAKFNGGTVSAKEWQSFVDKEITPRFPDGLTLLDGTGQWRTKTGTFIREHTRVLVIVHKPNREDGLRIAAIRARYRQLFGQELVLEVTSAVHASF